MCSRTATSSNDQLLKVGNLTTRRFGRDARQNKIYSDIPPAIGGSVRVTGHQALFTTFLPSKYYTSYSHYSILHFWRLLRGLSFPIILSQLHAPCAPKHIPKLTADIPQASKPQQTFLLHSTSIVNIPPFYLTHTSSRFITAPLLP